MKSAGFIFCFFSLIMVSSCFAGAMDSLVGEWQGTSVSASGQKMHDFSAGSYHSTLLIRPGEKEGTISGEYSLGSIRFENLPVTNGKFSLHSDLSSREFKFELRSDGTIRAESIDSGVGRGNFIIVFRRTK